MSVTDAKLTAVLHTSEYRGDHAADVEHHFDVKPGETVQQLVERANWYRDMGTSDYISIHVVVAVDKASK